MILLLDNYDSFVHNLARYFRRLGCETKVVRSDAINPDQCAALSPEAIVISPGPHGPEQAGCSVDVIRYANPKLPILGVCLGHLAIGTALGANVVQCRPLHGMASTITHDGRGMFAGCRSPMNVGRYHSLTLEKNDLPADLEVTATTEDGVVMGIRHRQRPLFGVQFHPESVLTDDGTKIIENFVALIKHASSNTSDREIVS